MNAFLQSSPLAHSISEFAESNRLPTLPEVALKLVQVAQQDEPDFRELSRIIRSDPVISGKILKTVNSALFGFRHKIEAIEQAIPKLGTTMLRTLILSFHLSQHESHQKELEPVLQNLWRSSLTQAVIAELIAEQIVGADPPTFFLAAMLQDIGILAMVSEAPAEYLENILDRARFPDVTTEERNYFGFSHVDVTMEILKRWGMGDSFGDAIQHHHDRVVPHIKGANNQLAVALQAASQGTEMLFSNRDSTIPLEVAVDNWASFLKSHLGIDEAHASEIVGEIDKGVNQYSALFSFNIGQNISSERLVAKAKSLIEEIALENQLKLLEQSKSRKRDVDDEAMYRDSLSGLYNRRYMHKKLGELMEVSIQKLTPLAFLFFDVDKFKSINDNHGHAAGDKTIQHIAEWLGKSTRKHDFAIRLGGDEFLVVMQQIKEMDLENVVRRIASDIPALELPSKELMPVSLSVGCTFYQPQKGDTPDPNWLIDQADQLMYHSKREGGGSFSIQKHEGTPK